MKKITITGVPEHFNYPWKQVVQRQPFLEKGIQLEWIDEPRGSGAMNISLREGGTDLAVVLTESFIRDKSEGNPALIVGFHVDSPLIWGIHGSGKSEIKDISELGHGDFVISRFGSGSHLMAFILAKREGWELNNLNFEVVGDLDGAKEALQDEIHKLFLWEKFTTKPLVDQGAFTRIGEIPTPWPCFIIAANPKVLMEHQAIVENLRDLVYQESINLSKRSDYASILSQAYHLNEEDIKSWLKQTKWAENNRIPLHSLQNTIDILKELGLIEKPISPEELVFRPLVELC
jgi:ABC-type nitrate/sulfonate/bicarbonate transport system substrate-binding protein